MTLRVHFDGKVLIPDEPVNLPVNCSLEVEVTSASGSTKKKAKSLRKLVEAARKCPVRNGSADGAAQHDHYLYGTAKRQ